MEDNVEIALYNKNGYNKALQKINYIEKNNDKEFVIANAKFLLNELRKNYESLTKNKFFLTNFKGNIKNEYEFTNEVLNSIINDGIEFKGNSINYINYDTWKEYYVKYNSYIFFNDWFITYKPIKWEINKLLFKYDYFFEPTRNNYLYNPQISDSYLISKYYYQINSLKFNDEIERITEIENYLIENKNSEQILIFWSFDE
ncbi:MAG: hypothetical protein J0L86_05005 [Flavobacteriales bacterium]|nr:hypothetical protein [Flavobacteriales bacterium]